MNPYRPIGSATIKLSSSNKLLSLGSISGPAGSVNANRVDVQALSSNGALLVVGDYQISADQSRGGIGLLPGDVYNIELITDLSSIYISGSAGDGVAINWWLGDRN